MSNFLSVQLYRRLSYQSFNVVFLPAKNMMRLILANGVSLQRVG